MQPMEHFTRARHDSPTLRPCRRCRDEIWGSAWARRHQVLTSLKVQGHPTRGFNNDHAPRIRESRVIGSSVVVSRFLSLDPRRVCVCTYIHILSLFKTPCLKVWIYTSKVYTHALKTKSLRKLVWKQMIARFFLSTWKKAMLTAVASSCLKISPSAWKKNTFARGWCYVRKL